MDVANFQQSSPASGVRGKAQPSGKVDVIYCRFSDDGSDREMSVTEVSKIDWETVDDRMKSAVGDLPLSYRSVFLLCAVEELKYREIADIVGLPVGTVMTQMYRARAMLAVRLASLAAEHGMSPDRKTQSREIAPPVR